VDAVMPKGVEPLIAWTILLGILVVGGLVIRRVRQWRKQTTPPPTTPAEQLALFQQLHEQGELSMAEWQQIQALLEAKQLPTAQPIAPEEASQIPPPPIQEPRQET